MPKWIRPARVTSSIRALSQWRTEAKSQAAMHLWPLLALVEVQGGKQGAFNFTEAHDVNRELFGPDRLTTLLERQAGEQHGEELLRSLVRAILDHQQGDLRDDATMLMLRWDGA